MSIAEYNPGLLGILQCPGEKRRGRIAGEYPLVDAVQFGIGTVLVGTRTRSHFELRLGQCKAVRHPQNGNGETPDE